jgi:hypothetical protein
MEGMRYMGDGCIALVFGGCAERAIILFLRMVFANNRPAMLYEICKCDPHFSKDQDHSLLMLLISSPKLCN